MPMSLADALQLATDGKDSRVRLVNLNINNEAVACAREGSDTEGLAW